jgi:acyl-CoA thioesterase I
MNNFLSEEEIKNLRILHKKEGDRKKCNQTKAILLSHGDWLTTLITEAIHLDEGTIRNHIKDYQSFKKLNIESGVSEEKFVPSQAKELKYRLEENIYTKVKGALVLFLFYFTVTYKFFIRQKNLINFLFLFFLSLCSYSQGKEHNDKKNIQSRLNMKKICVFGASITSGYNDTIDGGWCDLLKKYFLKDGICVFNLGIAGNDTNDLLKRLEQECYARQPDIIIIALGGNDSRYHIKEKKLRISPDIFENNFVKIVEVSKKFTSKIMLVGLTKVEEKTITPLFEESGVLYKNEYLEKYDGIIKKVAIQNFVEFIPTFDLNIEYDMDGLHPTSDGHKQLFKRIFQYMQQCEFVEKILDA